MAVNGGGERPNPVVARNNRMTHALGKVAITINFGYLRAAKNMLGAIRHLSSKRQ